MRYLTTLSDEYRSLGRRYLVNAYEVEAGIGVIAGNTVWSMPERLGREVLQKTRYINTFTFTFSGRPRRNWLQQVEEDIGLSVGAAWIAGQDRSMWRTLRPSAGQAQ